MKSDPRFVWFSVAMLLAAAGRVQAADSLTLKSLNPPSGVVPGVVPGLGVNGLTPPSVVAANFDYVLESASQAKLEVITQVPGNSPHTPLSYPNSANKGKGSRLVRFGVQCVAGPAATYDIKWIRFRMIDAATNATLAPGAQQVKFQFSCPASRVGPAGPRGDAVLQIPEGALKQSDPNLGGAVLNPGVLKSLATLKIVAFSKPQGATIQRALNDKSLTDQNSVKITYQYDLKSAPEAKIAQWAWVAPNAVAPDNFWTYHTITPQAPKAGTGTTRLGVHCKSPGQAPTVVKFINYKLVKTAGGQFVPSPNVLVNGTEPVNFTFKCGS